jgi:hypothetical protein
MLYECAQVRGDDFCSRSEVAEGSGSHGKSERSRRVMSWSTNDEVDCQHHTRINRRLKIVVGSWLIALILLPRRKSETLTIAPWHLQQVELSTISR